VHSNERKIGDLKLFEPKTMCPFIAVRDREERWPGLAWPWGMEAVWPAVYKTAGAAEIMAP
jgi:hypothetical protein